MEKETTANSLPRLGDRVRVPFGLEMLECPVVRTSDFGIGPRVTAELEIEGAASP